MKNANQYSQKDVQKRAFRLIYSVDNIILNRPPNVIRKRHRLDFRFNFDKEVFAFFLSHNISQSERQKIVALKKQRSLRKSGEYVTIFQRPLVKDWIKNKHNIKRIGDNVIQFYSRNHWAKDAKDLKILQVFRNAKKNQHATI